MSESTTNVQNKPTSLLAGFAITVGLILWWYVPIPYLFSLFMDFPPPYLIFIFLPIGLYSFFISIILGLPILYEILCIGGTAILLFALIFGTTSWLQKGLIIYLLCAIFLFMFRPYEAAVISTSDNTLLNPTQPSFFYRGLKNAQANGETEWCEYELHGWQDEALLYQETCVGGSTKTWSFTPDGQHNPIPASDLQNAELHVHPIPQSEVSDLVDSPGYQSPSGTWAAFISKHIYSAEDVMVLELSE